MKAMYFAWVRERIGVASEEIAPPSHVATVGDLVSWLRERGGGYEAAFENPAVIRAALDRRHAKPHEAIGGVAEVAFFPPMTGG